MRTVTAGVLALVVLAAVAGAVASASTAASPEPAIDIELAFDTTGSMAASLAVAKRNADSVLAGVRAIVPDARFAVVSFRDHGNPGGEYQTLQPLTASSSAITSAISASGRFTTPRPRTFRSSRTTSPSIGATPTTRSDGGRTPGRSSS